MQSPLAGSAGPSWKRDHDNSERMPPEALARRKRKFEARTEPARKRRETAA
jgi:hypothetical protein